MPTDIQGSIELNADDIFRPNLAAEIDDTRTWVSPDGYRLSDRLWLARQRDRAQIEAVLRDGLARGLSPLETARNVEHLLNPQYQLRRDPDTYRPLPLSQQPKGVATVKPRQGPGRGPARPRNSGIGSYAARRLARTETTNAFGTATKRAVEANPLVRRMKWRLSGHHHDSDQCDVNARQSSKDSPPGVYTTDELPRYPDHPHEMCTISPYVTQADIDDAIPRLRRAAADGDFSRDGMARPFAPAPAATFSERMDIGSFNRTPLESMRSAMKSGGFVDDAGELTPEWRELSGRYSQSEREALSYYKGSGYAQINNMLRGKTAMLPDDPVIRKTYEDNINGYIASIDSAFRKADPLTEPIRLTRQSGIDFMDVDNQKPGNLFIDDGYVSTTVKPEGVGFGSGLTMDIYVPPGVRVLPMDEIGSAGNLRGEQEVLLPRETAFRVVGVDRQRRRVILEVLP